MLQITIDETVNGFMISINDIKEGYYYKEIAERRVDALDIVRSWVKAEQQKEIAEIVRGTYAYKS
jgi:cephalosporin-C deacetylase-like acetyl esterase